MSRHKHGEFHIPRRKQGERTTDGENRRISAVTHHGHATDKGQTPEYRAWADMWNRCTNPNIKNYKFYGGRGITVCDRWRVFEKFIADMGVRPSSSHSIGRLDNEGNYSPDNCQWVTREEQDNNRRDSVILEHNGLRMTLAQWARHLGMSRNTINGRWKRGWNTQQIIEGIAPCGRRLPPKNSRRNSHALEESSGE